MSEEGTGAVGVVFLVRLVFLGLRRPASGSCRWR